MDDKNPYTTHIWPCAKENTFYPQPRENEMIITTKMIADIIAHHDPMALFSLGAPDEYFPEAELILEAFERFKSFDDFYKEVYDIFCKNHQMI